MVDRRQFVLCAAPALGLPPLFSAGSKASGLVDLSGEQNVENQSTASAGQGGNDGRRMVDVPLSPDTKVTIERRKQIVLIGINGRVPGVAPVRMVREAGWGSRPH